MYSLLFAIAAAGTINAQTTATDFTANDCSGVSHHLFAELESGKVIVAAFVMPCVGCIYPAQATQAVVESYSASHPGRVVMYLADDDATTSCAILNSWRNANDIHLMPTFSDSGFIQDYYGPPGMPKIVVLAGADHRIYDMQNDMVNTDQLKARIDAALGISTGLSVPAAVKSGFTLYPNPAAGDVTLTYIASRQGVAVMHITDARGRRVRTTDYKLKSGSNNLTIKTSGMVPGVYSVTLSAEEVTMEQQLIVK